MVRVSLLMVALLFALVIFYPRLPIDTNISFNREETASQETKTHPLIEQAEIVTSTPQLSTATATITQKNTEQKVQKPIVKQNPQLPPPPQLPAATTTSEIVINTEPRIPPLSPDVLNERARAALVNILCEAESPLKSTSGSGVIIDPRGIILTNAHIAQYFFFEDTPISASCTIRTGSPAVARWHAKLMFLPSAWVEEHVSDILNTKAQGTGEHDYAFLAITEPLDTKPSSSFPYIPLDSEEATSVTGDQVLVAGYPAEFVGGSAARNFLHSTTVFSSIKQFLTFTEKVVDVIAVGGTVLAQSGSSGGGFVDMYGSLVGIIVTTSLGDTTGERDLHAITPAHIDRSVRQHMGQSVKDFLAKDKNILVQEFQNGQFSKLSKKFYDAILAQQH